MERIQGIMRERIAGVAAANGCSTTVEFRGDVEYTNSRGEKYFTAGYPPKYNDPALVQMGFNSAVELFKEADGSADVDKIILNDESTALGGEDFSFFWHLGGVPSAMFSIGHQSADDPMTATAHHNENFKVRAPPPGAISRRRAGRSPARASA